MLKQLIFIGIAVFISGCSILEKVWLVPEVETEILFDPILDNKAIVDAIKIAVSKLDVYDPYFVPWDKEITYINVLDGILETGHYDRSNEVGAKLRAEIDRDDQLIRLYVKGTNIYYTSIPLQDGLRQIQTTVTCQLQEALSKVKRPPHR